MFHTKDIDICSMYIYNQFNFFFVKFSHFSTVIITAAAAAAAGHPETPEAYCLRIRWVSGNLCSPDSFGIRQFTIFEVHCVPPSQRSYL